MFSFLLGIYLGVKLLGHIVTPYLTFLKNLQMVFQSYYIILQYCLIC